MRYIRKSSPSRSEFYQGEHRFEHWYLNNCVYLITARCRDKRRLFANEAAKAIFWDRFDFYMKAHDFVPWITTLMDNHYHTVGYLRSGEKLGPMMQKIHGSVAKLVNDGMAERIVPFWHEHGRQAYFDGCIRDSTQARRAYQYILRQAVRAGIVKDWRQYPHTHVSVELQPALKRAEELKAFLENVPYARYDKPGQKSLPLKRQARKENRLGQHFAP